mgnify:CR=1 FL=1|tara:strand:+ start:890 stop:1474 length:585 start_codon:yes stop_codon:yes gene_type:complete
MKQSLPTLILALVCIASSGLAGDKATKLDFSSGALPDGFAVAKGEWKVVDGALYGAELESDHHGAVATITESHKDSVISFRFQVNGAKSFGLSYNHPAGHLFRVKIGAGQASLSLDKDKKDPESKAVNFDSKEFTAAAGEWVEMSCLIEGENVVVTCGDVTLKGSHPKLAMEKTGYRFVVAGSSVLIDDIKIGE